MLLVAGLYSFSVWFSWFALRTPERLWQGGWVRSVFWALFAIFTFVMLGPVLFGDTHTRNLYHIFFVWPLVYAILFPRFIPKIFGRLALFWWGRCIAVMLLLLPMEGVLATDFVRTGYVQEYGVEKFISYTSGFAVVEHLWVYVGFYLGLALVIVLFGMRRKVSASQGFLVGALWGLCVEQHFLVPQLILSGNFAALNTLVPFVALTYGWYVAGPLLIFSNSKVQSGASKKDLLVFFLLLLIFPIVLWLVWQRLIGWPQ